MVFPRGPCGERGGKNYNRDFPLARPGGSASFSYRGRPLLPSNLLLFRRVSAEASRKAKEKK
jgi:hypothetical protein